MYRGFPLRLPGNSPSVQHLTHIRLLCDFLIVYHKTALYAREIRNFFIFRFKRNRTQNGLDFTHGM